MNKMKRKIKQFFKNRKKVILRINMNNMPIEHIGDFYIENKIVPFVSLFKFYKNYKYRFLNREIEFKDVGLGIGLKYEKIKK